mgnify:FL=1
MLNSLTILIDDAIKKTYRIKSKVDKSYFLEIFTLQNNLQSFLEFRTT